MSGTADPIQDQEWENQKGGIVTAERLICDACAYVYRHESITEGMEDLMCSKKPHGTLRKPTRAEEILLRDYRNLYSLLEQRGPLPEPRERKVVA